MEGNNGLKDSVRFLIDPERLKAIIAREGGMPEIPNERRPQHIQKEDPNPIFAAIRSSRRAPSIQRGLKRIPCLDFFAGSGLVTKALAPYFSVAWANDICEKKAAVYRANHPSDPLHLGSIEQVKGHNLPNAVLSWASLPCQDL